MRCFWPAVIMTLTGATSQAAQTPLAIYDGDPEHLWNRLYRAIAVLVALCAAVDRGVRFPASGSSLQCTQGRSPRFGRASSS